MDYTIRPKNPEYDLRFIYGSDDSLFTLKIHHGGEFTDVPGREYVNGKVSYVDFIDIDKFSIHELDHFIQDLGYDGFKVIVYHFLRPNSDLDFGLEPLGSDDDVRNMLKYVKESRKKKKIVEISVYTEHELNPKVIVSEFVSPPSRSKFVLEEIVEEGQMTVKKKPKGKKSKVAKKLNVLSIEPPVVREEGGNVEPLVHSSQSEILREEAVVTEPEILREEDGDNVEPMVQSIEPEIVREEEVVNDEEMVQSNEAVNEIVREEDTVVEDEPLVQSNEAVNEIIREEDTVVEDEPLGQSNEAVNEDESDDDYIVDEENDIFDEFVDMRDFVNNIDSDVEYMGNSSKNTTEAEMDDYVDNEDFDIDQFDSDIGDEDDPGFMREKKLKELRAQEQERSAGVGTIRFTHGQEFGTKAEVTEAINLHAVESIRNLVIVKNDKRRVTAKCEGVIWKEPPKDVVVGESSGTKLNVKNKGKQKINSTTPKYKKTKSTSPNKDKNKKSHHRVKHIECEWKLHVSKESNADTWVVKTYKDVHECLESRVIRQCTSKLLSQKIVDHLQTNPDIPVRAVKAQLEKDLEVRIEPHKAFRALQKARQLIKGNYMDQYGDLRDYILELRRSNPGSTVKLEVQDCDNPSSMTRVFKRVYICLGPLKRGFKAIGRDLLGVDGAFMKKPAHGFLLTVVGLDANNGIYPLAYAIVESECYSSWVWLLELLATYLDLTEMSNFTFISDRQKGLIAAVLKVFPVAEHRFCLRHIQQNMKNYWRGVAIKNHLWACASATTVPQFERKMAEFKAFCEPAHYYHSKIPPAQWARSHFTGRAHSDILLNNHCEVLNRWLCDARDKPIVTALEYIRTYMMKRIANVRTTISKSKGPLSPTATKMFDNIKKEAMKCDVIWNGDDKYQVNGHHDDQCVVDMTLRTCSCRKWELTGMPCKHAVAAMLNMAVYSQDIVLESHVHEVYWLSTWEKTYSHTINPVKGKSDWVKSPVPTTLVCPNKTSTPGRPKKNRKKSIEEKDDMVVKGKLSKKGTTIKCSRCRKEGHNVRGCPDKGEGLKRKEASGKGTKGKASGKGCNKKAKTGNGGN